MSLLLPGGRKQAWVKDNVQKIHTGYEDGSECVEEFEAATGICRIRKWRKVDSLGRLSPWDFEIGEEPSAPAKQEIVAGLAEAANQPRVVRHDSENFYVFQITNMPWPKENYRVTVEDGQLVLRTQNKKYFKRFQISDLAWQKIPLHEAFVRFEAHNNTLLILYQKPPAVVQFEKAAKNARRDNIKEGQDGCRAE